MSRSVSGAEMEFKFLATFLISAEAEIWDFVGFGTRQNITCPFIHSSCRGASTERAPGDNNNQRNRGQCGIHKGNRVNQGQTWCFPPHTHATLVAL